MLTASKIYIASIILVLILSNFLHFSNSNWIVKAQEGCDNCDAGGGTDRGDNGDPPDSTGGGGGGSANDNPPPAQTGGSTDTPPGDGSGSTGSSGSTDSGAGGGNDSLQNTNSQIAQDFADKANEAQALQDRLDDPNSDLTDEEKAALGNQLNDLWSQANALNDQFNEGQRQINAQNSSQESSTVSAQDAASRVLDNPGSGDTPEDNLNKALKAYNINGGNNLSSDQRAADIGRIVQKYGENNGLSKEEIIAKAQDEAIKAEIVRGRPANDVAGAAAIAAQTAGGNAEDMATAAIEGAKRAGVTDINQLIAFGAIAANSLFTTNLAPLDEVSRGAVNAAFNAIKDTNWDPVKFGQSMAGLNTTKEEFEQKLLQAQATPEQAKAAADAWVASRLAQGVSTSSQIALPAPAPAPANNPPANNPPAQPPAAIPAQVPAAPAPATNEDPNLGFTQSQKSFGLPYQRDGWTVREAGGVFTRGSATDPVSVAYNIIINVDPKGTKTADVTITTTTKDNVQTVVIKKDDAPTSGFNTLKDLNNYASDQGGIPLSGQVGIK